MSFKHIHGDAMREAKLQKAEARRAKAEEAQRSTVAAKQQRRLDLLKKEEADIQNEISKVQGLARLSQLNDKLRDVRAEIARLQSHSL